MKKLLALLFIVMISGCTLEVGDFGEKRQSLYNKNTTDCEKEPQKCVHGYPW